MEIRVISEAGTRVFMEDEGIRLETLAKCVQDEYPHKIVLAYVRERGESSKGKPVFSLSELWRTIKKDCEVRFVTTGEAIGMETYRRSMTFLFIKAFYDVVGRNHMQDLVVQFSTSKGYYCEPKGDFLLTEELLVRVGSRMEALIWEDVPITKKIVRTKDAVERFKALGMTEKERLFAYRRVSATSLYFIEDFCDYFYGYMVPSCGYLRYFQLYLYEGGVLLQMPTTDSPEEVPPFVPQPKVFAELLKATRWGEKFDAATVAGLNQHIVNGTLDNLILIQEAMQEQQMSDIAQEIEKRGTVKFIMIAGPSSSGKTSFSHRLSIQLRACGLTPFPIGMDDYYLDRNLCPKNPDGSYNFEDLEAIDTRLFSENLNKLLAGERIEMPRFNFVTGKREYHGEYLQLKEKDILVIEGIHGLNPMLTKELPPENIFRIYLSALTMLNIDEHNRVSTADSRLIRRLVRDAKKRGTDAAETIRIWSNVRKGEERNIFPYQEMADVVFNSAQLYELALLKVYAEPLLYSVPVTSPEYQEAKRLLKFLDYFLAFPSDNIPKNSIIREFIGRSVFPV